MMKIPVKWDKPAGGGSVDAWMIGIGQSSSGEGTRPVAVVVEWRTGRVAFVDFRYLTADVDQMEAVNASA